MNKKEKRFCLKQVLFVNSGEDNWTMVQHQIQDISLSSTSAWMIGLDGTVYIQTQLSQARVSLCSSSSKKILLKSFLFVKMWTYKSVQYVRICRFEKLLRQSAEVVIWNLKKHMAVYSTTSTILSYFKLFLADLLLPYFCSLSRSSQRRSRSPIRPRGSSPPTGSFLSSLNPTERWWPGSDYRPRARKERTGSSSRARPKISSLSGSLQKKWKHLALTILYLRSFNTMSDEQLQSCFEYKMTSKLARDWFFEHWDVIMNYPDY